MCGICGFIHNRRVDEKVLYTMNQTISYRGPDDEGYYLDILENGMQLGLAQKRLAILDLSEAGHQPMQSYDGKIILVYNGEIYNFQAIKKELIQLGYVFRSNTDTEVIIYAYKQWGIKCVNKLNGMFAFVLYDKSRGELYLVRDRMGVKPLYYYKYNDNFVFASELKPIISYPYFQKEIDETALSLYLHHQYITGPHTVFKNTFKLEPGHVLCINSYESKLWKYWGVDDVYKNRIIYKKDFETAIEDLKTLLLSATQLRMISDVSLGGFLSGGVDSSLIVSLMKDLSNTPVQTFTVGFEEDAYDEAPYAKKIAEYLGTEHHEIYMSINEAKKNIFDLPIYFDEPMADVSSLATMLVSKIAKENVTVALSGDAGDELFCGYEKYSDFYHLKKYEQISRLINKIDYILPLKKWILKTGKRSLLKLFYLSCDDDIINSNYLTYWDKYNGLIKSEGDMEKYNSILKLDDNPQIKYMLQDLVTYLPDDILTKVDRGGMSVSLETRAPLLDYHVVEFALTLPHDYKFYNGEKKYILKRLLDSYIPEKLIDRPKKGFSVPVVQWLKEDYSSFVKHYFDKEYIQRQDIFNYEILNKIIDGFKKYNNPNYGKELWTLLVFQRWYEEYF